VETPTPIIADPLVRLDLAVRARADLFDTEHQSAFRLFNGFLEGAPDLAIDLYARTVVIHDYANPADPQRPAIVQAIDYLREQLPWVRAIILKSRHATEQIARRGIFVYGAEADRNVREHGVRYAVDLTMHRDTSLYLDTRGLRDWARRELGGKTVLNTFAYTGSLGRAFRVATLRRVAVDRSTVDPSFRIQRHDTFSFVPSTLAADATTLRAATRREYAVCRGHSRACAVSSRVSPSIS
jgi:23S rRNA (cytosine1962-C5)-methyltransferase